MMPNTLMLMIVMKKRMQNPARAVRRRVTALAGGNRGGLLIEVIIAMFVFTLVGTAILSGISTTQISGAEVESQAIAENIARNQIEYIMVQAYISPEDLDNYDFISFPAGYNLVITKDPLEVNVEGSLQTLDSDTIEKVVVTVTYQGNPVLTLETVKTSS